MMTAKQKKEAAVDLIMHHLSGIGYGRPFEEYAEQIGDIEEATAILKKQMDRAARLYGYKESWLS